MSFDWFVSLKEPDALTTPGSLFGFWTNCQKQQVLIQGTKNVYMSCTCMLVNHVLFLFF